MTQCGLKEHERAEILLSAGTGVDRLSMTAASHLQSCESCSEAFAEQNALWNRLDSWKIPEVSSGFNRELYAKIDAAIAQSWHERWAAQIKSVFAQPSLAVASAVLILIAGFVVDHSAVSHSAVIHSAINRVPAPRVSASEAEQVERTLDDLDMLRQFDLTAEEKETTSKSM